MKRRGGACSSGDGADHEGGGHEYANDTAGERAIGEQGGCGRRLRPSRISLYPPACPVGRLPQRPEPFPTSATGRGPLARSPAVSFVARHSWSATPPRFALFSAAIPVRR